MLQNEEQFTLPFVEDFDLPIKRVAIVLCRRIGDSAIEMSSVSGAWISRIFQVWICTRTSCGILTLEFEIPCFC